MKLRVGFIPLVDSAVLVAAADRGFAHAEGIDLELVREVSWSNIRDKLKLGHLEGAHLLAPLAIAETLGVDYARVPLTTPIVLSQNGNSILFEKNTAAALRSFAQGPLDDPAETGAALKRLIAARAARGEDRLTMAMTFPYSMHNYLLRFWMAAVGIDPDEDVRLVVLPPPYMVDALSEGHVHGFCVGAPWPSVGVEAGIGEIVQFGSDIVATCPEKVVAVRTSWDGENTEATDALVRALIRATRWCAEPENRAELAELLASPGRLNLAPDLIGRSLEGRVKVDPAGRTREDAHYLVIDPAAARPDPRQALWLYAQMVRWNHAAYTPEHAATVAASFSPARHDAALLSMVRPPVAGDGIGAFAGPEFDPDALADYLGRTA